MLFLKSNRIYIFITVLCIICLLAVISLWQDKKIHVGSITDTSEKFKPVLTIFESNEAKEGIRKLDSIFRRIKQPTLFDYVTFYNTESYYANWEGDYYKQIKYADSAIQLVEKQRGEGVLELKITDAYINKATGYYFLHNTEEAYSALYKGYTIAERYGDHINNCNIANDIAIKMYQQQLYDSAVVYFKHALQHHLLSQIELPHKNNKTQELLDDIGLCYTKLKNIDSALKYYKACVEFLNKPNTPLAIVDSNSKSRYLGALGVVKGNMAKVYVLKGNIDTAIQLYKEAIVLNNRKYGDIGDLQACIIQLADIYIAQKNVKEIPELLILLKQWFQVYAPVKNLMEYEKIEYNYYQQQKKPALALARLNQYLILKDSLDKEESDFKNKNINKELKEREQQLQISLLKKDNQLSKTYNWAFAIFSVIAVLILIMVYYYYQKEKRNLYKQAQLNQAILQQKREIEIVIDELEISNRQKEKLMNVMAHELRSPISGITAIANTLLQENNYSTEQEELLGMIENTSSSTLALINELLENKNNETIELNKQLIDINKLLQHTVDLLQFKAKEKQQNIVLHNLSSTKFIQLDADKIERVMTNLITNAIKFSTAKSSIIVKCIQQDDRIVLSVKDEGIGIPEAQQEQLFDGSNIIKRVGTNGEKSFGLGLSICKQIIVQHNGKIWVESQENIGSTFIIELPLNNI